ncbi:lipopolysaccharide assembly protein LapA domain-containing protein [Pseudomonas sp. Irchel 3F5]|uniref:lipopolysaccharide assembly protein LapA domain-containing protein n=1 Tax=Pseudomonas sp. Irchel 3F5 TaxID=2009002 RepID=UPI000BA2E715|nr:lipopolysaccharide assembly protein LapA domain-containing protein [Pseudomonas sp. Irchel 3F5]
MGKIKRLVIVLLLVGIALVTLMFSLENQQEVSIVFLGFIAPPLSVSLLVVLALLLGLVIGPLLACLILLGKGRRGRTAV